MKALEKEITERLIPIYKEYLEKELSKELSEKAKKEHSKWYPAVNVIMNDELGMAVSKLFTLAYPNVGPSPLLTKVEAKKILNQLEKV